MGVHKTGIFFMAKKADRNKPHTCSTISSISFSEADPDPFGTKLFCQIQHYIWSRPDIGSEMSYCAACIYSVQNVFLSDPEPDPTISTYVQKNGCQHLIFKQFFKL